MDRDGKKPNGAHFLIDKDGTVFQTASLYKTTDHVGMMQARCLWEKRCAPSSFGNDPRAEHASERQKKPPDRYPSNRDAIGIELVGEAPEQGRRTDKDKKVYIYVDVTDAQNSALKWLISMLTRSLGISMREIFKHPQVGRKNETEAQSAKW